jgi:transposase-like protein
VLKFGPAIARRLRQRRPRPSNRWHLDEMVVRIAGERLYLWRAVDDEGEVLDMLVQRRRDSWTALRLMRKLLKKQGFVPKLLVTDKLKLECVIGPVTPHRCIYRVTSWSMNLLVRAGNAAVYIRFC